MKVIFRVALTAILALLVLTATLCGCGQQASGNPDDPATPFSHIDPEAFAQPSAEYGILKMSHSLNNLYGEDVLDGFLESTLLKKGYAGMVTNYPQGGSYLTGDRYWEILTEQIGWLEDKGIRVWIYDEYGYPSGGAGTLTLEGHPEYEALGLARVTGVSEDGQVAIPLPATHEIPFAAYAYTGTGDADKDLSTRVDVTDCIDPETGALLWSCPDDQVWFAETFGLKPLYDDTHAEGNASQDRRYIDIMNRDAVGRFIDLTYQAYYDHLGEALFSHIEAFFTDEPSIIAMYLGDFGANVTVVDQPNPDFVRWPTVAWSTAFFDEFQSRMGYDLAPHLSELFYGADQQASRIRYDYWTVTAALISENYYGQIGDWCRAHGVNFSGHQLAEEALNQQVICEGNFFQNYQQMTFPGIDMLSASPEQVLKQAMTPKMASSAAHLYGYSGVMSETSEYNLKDASGNLTISTDEVRCSLALQYALGVNQITSYFAYNDLSPDGEEPQDLTGKMVGRLGQTIAQGTHTCDVALYYPCETIYAELIPTTENWDEPRSPRVGTTTDSYQAAFYALLRSQLDLDILPAQSFTDVSCGEGSFTTAGGESYKVLVIPTLSMLSTETIETFSELAEAGVQLVFLPQNELITPTGEDTAAALTLWQAVQSEESASHAESSAALPKTVRNALGLCDLTVSEGDLNNSEFMNGGASLIYGHWEIDSGDLYLLVRPAIGALNTDVTFRATGSVNRLDPFTGEITALTGADNGDGTTTVTLDFDSYGYYFVEFVR